VDALKFRLKPLCLPLALALLPALTLAAEQPLEYQVKAAFLLKFTGFVEWPPPPDTHSPFSLCIVGEDPFGHVLDQLVEGENVNGRKIVVRRIHREASGSCALVYIAAQEKNIEEILTAAGPGVLTVGEGETFLDRGGMIAFVIENRRVRFDIDAGIARKAGLKISSRLLNVARIVR
jgi:hypothetical protein